MLSFVSLAVFSAGALLIFHVLVGYPLLLRFLAHRYGRPIRRAAVACRITVILPVRNGALWIESKLRSILQQSYPRELTEILVVSDGSTDGSDDIASRFAGQGVRLLRLPSGGKPAALNAAFREATGEILVLTDVRQALAPDCIQNLLAAFADQSVGAVSGNLRIRRGTTQEEASTGLYYRYEAWIRHNLSRLDSLLGAYGPIYAIRARLARPIPVDCLLDDVYLPMSALLQGYRLVLEESALAWDYPTDLSSEFARKVRTQAGIYQLLWLMPSLLGPANRMWFHYLSLKLGRLALPYLFVLLMVASFWLPSPLREFALAAQALCYLLACLDGFIPETSPAKRVSGIARGFLTLVLAALFAVQIFFVPPQSLWKHTRVSA